MRFLIIGLGSMGRRRVRCLRALGFNADQIRGFDTRDDRRKQAKETLGIEVFDDVKAALSPRPDGVLICVPPDHHHEYMELAVDERLHFFVEASVLDMGMERLEAASKAAGIIAAPSSTLLFHPALKRITSLVRDGAIGKLSNIVYHVGQYLPDWHTYEHVRDFYVSNPATGGAREIVPHELTWIVRFLGWPSAVYANVRKTITIEGAEEIADTYNCLMDYGDKLVNMTVDVVSRSATRRLVANGDRGQLVWDWNQGSVGVFDATSREWRQHRYDLGQVTAGYNANIGEKMYIDELGAFVDALRGKSVYCNTLEEDRRVLAILYAFERADKEGVVQKI